MGDATELMVIALQSMETEIEAKFLDINPDLIRDKLKNVGAKLIHPERLMMRYNFDFPDRRLEKIGGWVRVRDEGDKVTLSYKQLNDRTLHGTKDATVAVDNFDVTRNLLKAIGLEEKAYQETKREKWVLGRAEITIDTWPWIPTFAEIEAPSEGELRSVSSELGLDLSKAKHGSVEIAYQEYFNATDEEIYNWERIAFGPAPPWLKARRRQAETKEI